MHERRHEVALGPGPPSGGVGRARCEGCPLVGGEEPVGGKHGTERMPWGGLAGRVRPPRSRAARLPADLPPRLPSSGGGPGRAGVAGADGGARGARRLRHRRAPRAPPRPPQAPGRGLPLHLLLSSPAQLRRWHPGAGVGARRSGRLAARRLALLRRRRGRRRRRRRGLLAARGDTLRFVRELLVAHGRRGRHGFGCFGLHEWAMVYRLDPADVRHAGWPLRLGAAGTDAVVEAHQIALLALRRLPLLHPRRRAAQRAARRPVRASRRSSSRAACTPGWTSTSGRYKLGPAGPERAGRGLLRAGPRHPRRSTCGPRPTTCASSATSRCASRPPRARPQYAAAQRGFSARGQALRARLVDAIDRITSTPPSSRVPTSRRAGRAGT